MLPSAVHKSPNNFKIIWRSLKETEMKLIDCVKKARFVLLALILLIALLFIPYPERVHQDMHSSTTDTVVTLKGWRLRRVIGQDIWKLKLIFHVDSQETEVPVDTKAQTQLDWPEDNSRWYIMYTMFFYDDDWSGGTLIMSSDKKLIYLYQERIVPEDTVFVVKQELEHFAELNDYVRSIHYLSPTQN